MKTNTSSQYHEKTSNAPANTHFRSEALKTDTKIQSKNENIKICAWNIYGLDNHKLQPDVIGEFLAQNHIILLSETWADHNTEYTLNSKFESVNVPRKYKHRLA